MNTDYLIHEYKYKRRLGLSHLQCIQGYNSDEIRAIRRYKRIKKRRMRVKLLRLSILLVLYAFILYVIIPFYIN